MVDVYTRAHCQPCRMTCRALDKLGIAYRLLDAADHAEALRELGHQSAPVVVTPDGRHWSGFRPDLIAQIADQHKEDDL